MSGPSVMVRHRATIFSLALLCPEGLARFEVDIDQIVLVRCSMALRDRFDPYTTFHVVDLLLDKNRVSWQKNQSVKEIGPMKHVNDICLAVDRKGRQKYTG